MDLIKAEILKNLCYTELVYQRINKKLNIRFSKVKIEEYIFNILKESSVKCYTRTGKNYYILNPENNIRITINAHTFRVITVDKLK